jgi:hypothetical protein
MHKTTIYFPDDVWAVLENRKTQLQGSINDQVILALRRQYNIPIPEAKEPKATGCAECKS